MKQVGQTLVTGSGLRTAVARGAAAVLVRRGFGAATGATTTGGGGGGTQPGGSGEVMSRAASTSRAASVGRCFGVVTMSCGDAPPSRKVWASGRIAGGSRRCRHRGAAAPRWVIVTRSGRFQATSVQSFSRLIAHAAMAASPASPAARSAIRSGLRKRPSTRMAPGWGRTTTYPSKRIVSATSASGSSV